MASADGLEADAQPSFERYWQGGETLNYAIGQGALAGDASADGQSHVRWSPTAARSGSLIWSRSRSVSAQFVEHLGSPRMVNHIVLSENPWRSSARGWWRWCATGPAPPRRSRGSMWPARTGTAQVPKGKEHAWFVAYAPADKPRGGLQRRGGARRPRRQRWPPRSRMTSWRWSSSTKRPDSIERRRTAEVEGD